MAGIDKKIIDRANEILYKVEQNHQLTNTTKKSVESNQQLSISDYKKDYLIEKLNNIDISRLTPIESINILYDLIEEAKKLKERA